MKHHFPQLKKNWYVRNKCSSVMNLREEEVERGEGEELEGKEEGGESSF
jgi:hypothetical protein